jgi:hypothetical protein
LAFIIKIYRDARSSEYKENNLFEHSNELLVCLKCEQLSNSSVEAN